MTIPMLPPDSDYTEAVKKTFSGEIYKRMGPNFTDALEVLFLEQTGKFIDVEKWETAHFDAATILFEDYRNALLLMGTVARKLGLTVSIGIRLFEDPITMLRHGGMIHWLRAIKELL